MWSLTAHKLYRRSLVAEHGLRFAEGVRLAEEQAFVVPAYFLARAISVVADYDCYYLVQRDGFDHLTRQVVEPEPFYAQVRGAVETVLAHTEPGADRDGLLLRWVQEELLNRFRGEFLDWSDDLRERYARESGAILAELVPDSALTALPPLDRIRVRLLREGAHRTRRPRPPPAGRLPRPRRRPPRRPRLPRRDAHRADPAARRLRPRPAPAEPAAAAHRRRTGGRAPAARRGRRPLHRPRPRRPGRPARPGQLAPPAAPAARDGHLRHAAAPRRPRPGRTGQARAGQRPTARHPDPHRPQGRGAARRPLAARGGRRTAPPTVLNACGRRRGPYRSAAAPAGAARARRATCARGRGAPPRSARGRAAR
ncbi:hypothetical protein ACFQ1I_19015 [Kitasatospora arboriphila]